MLSSRTGLCPGTTEPSGDIHIRSVVEFSGDSERKKTAKDPGALGLHIGSPSQPLFLGSTRGSAGSEGTRVLGEQTGLYCLGEGN